MKPHSYTCKVREIANGNTINVVVEDMTSMTAAKKKMLSDPYWSEAAGWKVLVGSFRREDTAKGADRAGGLDSNGKQRNARPVRQSIEAQAYKDFLKHLNIAIENLFLCRMENNSAVLSYPIKLLYEEMKDFDPFAK